MKTISLECMLFVLQLHAMCIRQRHIICIILYMHFVSVIKTSHLNIFDRSHPVVFAIFIKYLGNRMEHFCYTHS
jgi:hypothetical protein